LHHGIWDGSSWDVVAFMAAKADTELCGYVALRLPFTYMEYVGNIAVMGGITGFPDESNSTTL